MVDFGNLLHLLVAALTATFFLIKVIQAISEAMFGIILFGDIRPGKMMPIWKFISGHQVNPTYQVDQMFRSENVDTIVLSIPVLGKQVLTRDAHLISAIMRDSVNFVFGDRLVKGVGSMFPGELLIQAPNSQRHMEQRCAMKGLLFNKDFANLQMEPLAKDLSILFDMWDKIPVSDSFNVLPQLYFLAFRRSARLFLTDEATILEELSMETMPGWMRFHADFTHIMNMHMFPPLGMHSLIPLATNHSHKSIMAQQAAFRERTMSFLAGQYNLQDRMSLAVPMMQAGLDTSVVSDQMVDTLAAAFNEIIAICCVFQQLEKHPEALAKVRQEIDSVWPEDRTEYVSQVNSWELTMSSYDRLPYCQQVIKEILRLFPPVPGIIRSVMSDQLGLKKGDYVIMLLPSLHCDEKLWGPDAAEFCPERWSQPMAEFHKGNDGKRVRRYMPFGIGNKACLGQRIATVGLVTTIALMYRFFDIEVSKNRPMQLKIFAQLCVTGTDGVVITARPRQCLCRQQT